MQLMRVRLRSRSSGEMQRRPRRAPAAPEWKRGWREAEAGERLKVQRDAAPGRSRAKIWIAPTAVLAALLPGILPLTRGFSRGDPLAAVVAAAVTALVALGIVPFATLVARDVPHAGARDELVETLALLSVGAAAIHFAVVKMHFDEDTLFGVFFVGTGIAQLLAGVPAAAPPRLLAASALSESLVRLTSAAIIDATDAAVN